MSEQSVSVEIPWDGRAFCGSRFGWRFEEMSDPLAYQRTQINELAGGSVRDMEPWMRVCFYVDDTEAAVERVRDLGGKSDESHPVPGRGWFALCSDPHGDDFGPWRRDEGAPVPE